MLTKRALVLAAFAVAGTASMASAAMPSRLPLLGDAFSEVAPSDAVRNQLEGVIQEAAARKKTVKAPKPKPKPFVRGGPPTCVPACR